MKQTSISWQNLWCSLWFQFNAFFQDFEEAYQVFCLYQQPRQVIHIAFIFVLRSVHLEADYLTIGILGTGLEF